MVQFIVGILFTLCCIFVYMDYVDIDDQSDSFYTWFVKNFIK
jgi:hypothetical protein